MATAMENLKLELQGLVEPGQANKSDARSVSSRALRRIVVAHGLIANEALANTASDQTLFRTTNRIRLISARFIPVTAMNADGTDYANILITNDDDAGGSDTTSAKLITGSGGIGNLAAGRTGAFTVQTASDADVIAASRAVHFVTEKAGSGVIVPICRVELEYEEV